MPTLRALLVGGPMYEPLYARLEKFTDITGLQLEVVKSLDHPDLNQRIETEFGDGTARYDLISTHTKYAPGQAQWLTALPEILEEELADFEPRTIELARIGGELKSIPRNLDIKLLYYRKDLIEHPPKTWEEFKTVALEQTRDGRYGFVFPGKESGLFGHFYELTAMAGANLFKGSSTERLEVHTDTDAARWALGFLLELYEKTAPKEISDWHYDEVSQCFRDGHATMTTDWPGGFYQYNAPTSSVRDQFDLAIYPTGPTGRQIYAGSHAFAIPTTVQDRPAALQMLRYLTSEPSQTLEARQGSLPTRKKALETVKGEAEPGSLAEKRWKLLGQASRSTLIPPKHAKYPACEDIIWRVVRKALTRELEVEAALTWIEEEAKRMLE